MRVAVLNNDTGKNHWSRHYHVVPFFTLGDLSLGPKITSFHFFSGEHSAQLHLLLQMSSCQCFGADYFCISIHSGSVKHC